MWRMSKTFSRKEEVDLILSHYIAVNQDVFYVEMNPKAAAGHWKLF